jgi:myo-inositol-1-phosphate synthase
VVRRQILNTGCAFVSCIPVFIASQPYWRKPSTQRGLDPWRRYQVQLGATIALPVLTHLFEARCVRLDRTYQLNFGNTHFLSPCSSGSD